MGKLLTKLLSAAGFVFLCSCVSTFGQDEVRLVYDNPLDGLNKTAEDHGLTVIPGGFQNAESGSTTFGQLRGIFRRQYQTYPSLNAKATNGELMGMRITGSSTRGSQVNVVLGKPVEVNHLALFRFYVSAEEYATITIGLIDPVFNSLFAASTWEYIPDEESQSDFSEWKLIHVLFEPKSTQVQPLIQVTSSSSNWRISFVYIDNLQIYDVPKDSETIKVLLDHENQNSEN